ncbi:MAG TPA: ABC transporter ATP-binding protein [Myxococcales bacterium]|jgi:iron complex transport system ATP-binding protein|nr:ABC transporter ATP-binding protein [Myxococcales bacterium]
MTAPLLLDAEGLHFRHAAGAPEAVSGASLRVASGEIVGVIGPNAAGKSTLARLACGLLAAQGGEVSLQGTPLQRLSRRERARRVAFLPQQHPQDLTFTAREVALMGRAPHLGLWSLEGPGDLMLADAALREADALELADRPIAQLSGGERQRVFLARAFAQDAALLVLDEPTAGLDLAHQVLLVAALRRRARQGGGAMLVLHDLALAGAACDRLALMLCGRVLAQGTPETVLTPEVLSPAYATQVDVVPDPATGQRLVAPRIPR